jgi:pimeloyl-ACP methyl ester carboxylesterase
MSREMMVPVGDGVELYVRRLGSPAIPPLVVVHGGPSWDHSYLLPALGSLTDLREVILVDLRGCGRSSRDLPEHAYRHHLAAEDLSILITRLGMDQPDVLGFSYGGSLALRLIEHHPDQVGRLILASASAYGDVRVDSDLAAERARRMGNDQPDFGDPRLDPLTRTRDDAMRSAVVHVWDLGLVPAWRSVLARIRFSGDWLPPFEAGLLGPSRPADPEAILRIARTSTLILHGEKDMGFPVDAARRLHAAVPDSELAIVAAAAHMAHFERPEIWLDHIRRFLLR